MEKRKLGNTDMVVARLSCGGLFISSVGAEFEEGVKAVHRALEKGMNYIDTAPGYANSEEVLGAALKDITTPYYLSTKFGGRPQPFNPKSKDHLYYSFDESLRLLKRNTIDILYIHEPDRPQQYDWYDSWDTFHGPVTEVLEDLKKRGLIRYTGLGGTTVYELTRIVEKGNYDMLLTAFEYSLLWREAGLTLIPAAKKKGMGIVAGSPLQQGWLSQRYDFIGDNPPAWLSKARREQLIRLYDYSDAIGISVPELAMRWILSNPDIDTILTGVRSVEEVDTNVGYAEMPPLSPEIMSELDDIHDMVPFRPCEEPYGCALRNPTYRGPGWLR